MSSEYSKANLQSSYETSSPSVDVEQAWMKLRLRMEERERDKRRRPSRPYLVLVVLAVVVVISAVSVGAFAAVTHLGRHGQTIVLGDGTTVSSQAPGASTTKDIAPEAVTFDTFTERFGALLTQRKLAGTLPFSPIPTEDLTWLSEAAHPLTVTDLKGYKLANGDIVVLFYTRPSFFTSTQAEQDTVFPAGDESITMALRQRYPGSTFLIVDLDFGYLVVSQEYGDELRNLADTARLGSTSKWPTNARGLTYGPGPNALSPQDEPDLVLATATNGKDGYVLATDLEGPTPSSPEEALAWQAARAGKAWVIPVYQSDGITQIGVFELGAASTSSETSLPSGVRIGVMIPFCMLYQGRLYTCTGQAVDATNDTPTHVSIVGFGLSALDQNGVVDPSSPQYDIYAIKGTDQEKAIAVKFQGIGSTGPIWVWLTYERKK